MEADLDGDIDVGAGEICFMIDNSREDHTILI